MHLTAGEDGPLGVLQVLELHVQHQRFPHGAGLGDGVPPGEVALSRPRQVHRHPLSGEGRLHVLPVDLQIPHPRLEAGGENLRHVANGQRPLDEGPGDHGAEAVHGEHPVNGQAEGGAQVLLRRRPDELPELLPEFADALPGVGGDGVDRLALQEGALGLGLHVLFDHLDPIRLHHVALGDDHQAVPDAQEGEDAQVLHRLGHEPLVGGHHQHGQVDAPRPGQHVFDELLVARHVHDARLGAVGEVQVGEAQLDGDAPLLLLHQPVGVDAGEGLDQEGLAVVHMARGADDDMLQETASFTARQISSTSSSRRVRTSSRYCP